MAKYKREWVQARRAAWINSQGGACVQCGSTQQLEVDHIDPNLKQFRPTQLWSRTEEVRKAELANCQVLCRSCHRIKTNDQRRPKDHGYYMYNHGGCRCDICRQANRDMRRKYREKKIEAAMTTVLKGV